MGEVEGKELTLIVAIVVQRIAIVGIYFSCSVQFQRANVHTLESFHLRDLSNCTTPSRV